MDEKVTKSRGLRDGLAGTPAPTSDEKIALAAPNARSDFALAAPKAAPILALPVPDGRQKFALAAPKAPPQGRLSMRWRC